MGAYYSGIIDWRYTKRPVTCGYECDYPDNVSYAYSDYAYNQVMELIDREKELARLEKEKAACQKDIDFLSGKLSNAGFVAKAPEKVIAMEREKLAKAEEKLARIEESIRNLG